MSTAYTYPYPSIVNSIVIKCHLALPGDETTETNELLALWDTGAMITCVSNTIAQQLGLTQVNTVDVKGANNEPFSAPVYIVRLRMGRFVLPAIQVVGLPMENAGHDIIIGMDIISKGDFAITNFRGKTIITFREPSLEKIDFVENLNTFKRYWKIHLVNLRKGVPDKCGCGSGRNFNNCHGKSPYAKLLTSKNIE